jgi:hypothetical protein
MRDQGVGVTGDDLASHLQPGQLTRARRRRIGTLALQHVRAVDARS